MNQKDHEMDDPMKTYGKKILLPALLCVLFMVDANAAPVESKWLRLDADSKERIKSLIKSDVESRKGFSTPDEDRLNTSVVQTEREKENAAYKAAIDAANSEYRRSKKRSDDLTAQYQTMAYDYEESKKNFNNLKTGITNIDNQIERYQKDIRSQQKALEKSLKTTKLGEAIVAVVYTRGFMDSAHKLERKADQASAPLIAEHMGTYIRSFTSVINNVLSKDFIRAVQEGTAKWDRKEPLLIALSKGSKGTTYLRLKRYELYPFQAPEKGRVKNAKTAAGKTAIIGSIEDLKSLLSRNSFSAGSDKLELVESMIRDTKSVNKQARANHREQLLSFKERLDYLEGKIKTAQTDRQSMAMMHTEKATRLKKMKDDLGVLKLKKDSAELAFQNAQAALAEKKRVHESIIIKSSVVIVKRSETPAKASSEAVIEELRDVLNDARLQHYSSTTDVVNGKLVAESDDQAITKAKIIAVRPLSFINEGDSIRVKIAFRVRTILDAKEEGTATVRPKPKPAAANTTVKKTKAALPQPKSTKPSAKPTPAKKKRPAPSTKKPSVALKKKSQKPRPPTPMAKATEAKPKMRANALGFSFNLRKISSSGKNLIFHVSSKNNNKNIRYLAVYDQDSRYAESSISGPKIKPNVVKKVYLYEGKKRTPSIDAYRGIPVKPGQSILVELIFQTAPNTKSRMSKLDFVPAIGTRSVFKTYRWRSEKIPFKNIAMP